MAKTFNNRQLVGGNQIKNDYQKINLNADELNADLTDLYAQDAILQSNIDSQGTIINQRILDHVQGILERHSSNDIDNDTPITGVDLTDVIVNLKSQIDSIVAGGTGADPRLSQALVDLLGVTWTNFKDLQDFWQEHNVIFDERTSTYYKIKEQISATGKPQLIYEEVL